MKAAEPIKYTLQEYAAIIGKTPQAVLWKIKHSKLPTDVVAKKVEGRWVMEIKNGAK